MADGCDLVPWNRERIQYLKEQGLLPSRMGLTCAYEKHVGLELTEACETLYFTKQQNRVKLDYAIRQAEADVARVENQARQWAIG